MSIALALPLAGVVGYIIGSLPIGYVLVYLIKGQDLRDTGSGRTGGTNAMRAAGLFIGVVTAVTDLAKGAGSIWIARSLAGDAGYLRWAEAVAAVAAVTGHNWSIFLGLKGGAGTTPNLGAVIALWPVYGLLLIPAGLATLLVTGYASVASLVIAVAIPLGFGVRALTSQEPWAYACYGLATAILVVAALLPNIRRLRAGTERVVGPRARASRRVEDARHP
jgi:glycerol-3-phosphate acyltransferase PlsY